MRCSTFRRLLAVAGLLLGSTGLSVWGADPPLPRDLEEARAAETQPASSVELKAWDSVGESTPRSRRFAARRHAARVAQWGADVPSPVPLAANPYIEPAPSDSLSSNSVVPYPPAPFPYNAYVYPSLPMYSWPTYQYYMWTPMAEVDYVSRPFYTKAMYQYRPIRYVCGVPVALPTAAGYNYRIGPYQFGYQIRMPW